MDRGFSMARAALGSEPEGGQDIFCDAFWVDVGTPAIAGEEVILGLLYKTQDCWSTRLSFSFCHAPLSSQAISQALSHGQTKMNSATQFTNNNNRE